MKKLFLVIVCLLFVSCSSTNKNNQMYKVEKEDVKLNFEQIQFNNDVVLKTTESWSTLEQRNNQDDLFLSIVSFLDSNNGHFGQTHMIYHTNLENQELENVFEMNEDKRIISFTIHNGFYFYLAIHASDQLQYEFIKEDKMGNQIIIDSGKLVDLTSLPLLYFEGSSFYLLKNSLTNEAKELQVLKYDIELDQIKQLTTFKLEHDESFHANSIMISSAENITLATSTDTQSNVYIYQNNRIDKIVLDNQISQVYALNNALFITSIDSQNNSPIYQVLDIKTRVISTIQLDLDITFIGSNINDNLFATFSSQNDINLISINKNIISYSQIEPLFNKIPLVRYVNQQLLLIYFNEQGFYDFYTTSDVFIPKK